MDDLTSDGPFRLRTKSRQRNDTLALRKLPLLLSATWLVGALCGALAASAMSREQAPASQPAAAVADVLQKAQPVSASDCVDNVIPKEGTGDANGLVTNTCDQPVSAVEVEIQHLSSNGWVSGSVFVRTGTLMPMQTWRWHVDARGDHWRAVSVAARW